ncbi:MAG TPA: ATP-binding cassette domain-containing protein [Gemmatimonadaceae bacterium]|nr:ATP-binding cassette domain-containing protein [Gemmatimonadaceae bacterium]
MRDTAPAIVLRGITKRFGAVAALAGADVVVERGTVHALLGENGAGKTTLMRIAFGLVAPDEGTIERNGRALRLRTPLDAIAAGIGMVHQHFSLVPAMTVAENIALGGRGAFSTRDAVERVRRASVAAGLDVDPTALAADLSVSMQQRVEILKAFAHGATLLILDEPTAVLPPRDARALLSQLRDFARAGGAVVLITHKLREALSAADDVTVLRRGATVFHARVTDATEDRLVEALVGARAAPVQSTHGTPRGAPVLRAEGVGVEIDGVVRLTEASVSAHSGEIVGIASVEGNGERELLRVLVGTQPIARGSVERPARVAFIPEDRHRDALVDEFSLTENLALGDAARRRGRMAWRSLGAEAQRVMSAFDVRASAPSVLAATLSGGNQQRFVIGRALRDEPQAIVAENPSRGLDVRATAFVHDALRAARNRGSAVVVYSSDIDELVELCDRVIVCFAGRVREVPATAAAIGQALVGAAS